MRALKKSRQVLQGRHASDDGSNLGTNTKGNEVELQQLQMTTIVANKICDKFDRLAALNKRRDLLIANLQHKYNSIEEVIQFALMKNSKYLKLEWN